MKDWFVRKIKRTAKGFVRFVAQTAAALLFGIVVAVVLHFTGIYKAGASVKPLPAEIETVHRPAPEKVPMNKWSEEERMLVRAYIEKHGMDATIKALQEHRSLSQ